MSKTTPTSAFNAFRATGAELRQLSAANFQPAIDELNRRCNSGKGGYVRTSLRAGVKPACWTHTQPQPGTAEAVLASLAAGKAPVAPKGEPKPVAAPKAPRDTIAAVRKDMAVLSTNVASLAASVDALAKAVSASMVK